VVVAAGLFLVARTVRYSPTLAPRLLAMIAAVAMIVPAFYTVRLLTAKPYTWRPYTPQALAEARAQGKVVLVDFTADWCSNCHALEAFVLNRPTVVKTVDDYQVVMLKADVTAEQSPGRPLLNQLNPVGAIPLTAIYSPTLKEPIQLNGIYQTTDVRRAIERAAGR
jgi:thiol:disulfide interchange protein